jgi:predicted DCC family thiol-disulfide oxidoreductase YuxK
MTLYVDQTCAMCVGAADAALQHDTAGRLRLADLKDAPPRLSHPELLRALHVVDAEGTVFRGYDAVVAILVSSRRRRWLGPLLSTAPVRWVGTRVYGIVANRRHRPRRWSRSGT